MNKIITAGKDKELKEEKIIRSALSRCGYPKWAFTQVKDKMANKQVKRKKSKKDTTKNSKGYVHIPYVEGIAEKATCIFSDMTY